MTTLTKAFNQWSTRPSDERFSSLADLHAAVAEHHAIALEAPSTRLNSLRIDTQEFARDGAPPVVEPVLVGGSGARARFSHWSFSQFCRRLNAPASYLRELPAELVQRNLEHGLARADRRDEDNNKLLFAQNGGLMLRALTTDSYTRIWNVDIVRRLIDLTHTNPEWQPAPPAFDGSRGLYASDKDIFCFLVDNDRRIFESAPGGGLGRGFFIWNSEVGDRAFGLMTFFYEYVCGNHRVWGAKGVAELKIRHVGDADERAFRQVRVELRKYADASAREDEMKIARARTFELGGSKDEVIDKVFSLGLTKRLAEQTFAKAEEREDWYGNPRSAWGFTGALTEIARDLPHADERAKAEQQAGKILQIAF